MALQLRRALMTMLYSLVEIICFFPLLLLLFVAAGMQHFLWLWIAVLFALYVLGVFQQFIFRTTRRYVIVLAAVAWGSAAALLIEGFTLYALLPGTLGVFAFYRGMRMGMTSWQVLFPPVLLWVSLIFYFAFSFVIRFSATFEPFIPIINGFGFACLIAALFYGNVLHLKQEMMDRNKPVRGGLAWKNRFMLVLLLLAVIVIGAYRTLYDWFHQAFVSTLVWIGRLAERLGGHGAEEKEVDTSPPPAFANGLPEGESSALARIFEQIMYYVLIGVIAVAAVALVYAIWKSLKKGLGMLLVWMNSQQAFELTDDKPVYVDEQVDLRKDMPTRSWRERLADMFGAGDVKWGELSDNRERIRYLYRQFILHRMQAGYDFKKSYSPNETWADIVKWHNEQKRTVQQVTDERLAELYNKARYSTHFLHDEEVEQIKHVLIKNK